MANTYELITLNDVFYKVPADRIQGCLLEIGAAFTQAAIMRDSMAELMELSGIEFDKASILELPEKHTWVDDGEGNVDVSVSVNGEYVTSTRTVIGYV